MNMKNSRVNGPDLTGDWLVVELRDLMYLYTYYHPVGVSPIDAELQRLEQNLLENTSYLVYTDGDFKIWAAQYNY